ncbi:fimbrial protein [Providencia alcalifaciens]|uniref:fimbrial protein n=1 Tax=Providencia alcalifaciens TaxID=126385 RepID=UPI002B057FB8|nr:fimbrial protein [Providencia alcalifaciens]
MKNNGQMTLMALALLLGSSVVYAERNANVEIIGNIVTNTCDIYIPQHSYDLGNHAPEEFGKNGSANSVGRHQFILTVKNCSGTLVKKGDRLSLQVNEMGNTNNADAQNFYGEDNGTNAGVELTMEGGVSILAQQVSPVHPTYDIYVAQNDGESLAGQQWLVMVAAEMAAVAVPAPGKIKANLQFTMAE